MKNFVFLLAVFLSVPAAFAVDVEIGGQHRARGVYDQNRSLDNIFVQRFKLSGAFRPNEMFESKFWLMTNYQWGEQALQNNEIRFYGYGDWKMSDELMLRLGRAPYQIADGSTIGMNDYEAYPYAFDGAFLTYNTKSVGVDLWAAYLPKVQAGVEEVDKYNVAAGFSLDVRSLPEVVKLANLFALVYTEAAGDANHVRFGVGVGGDVAGLDYRVNAVAHGALSNQIVEQYAVDGQLGYAIDAADLRVYVGGHYESGEYDSFYYSSHYRSGLLDVAQWGNGTTYGEVGLSYLFNEDCEVGLAGYYFLKVGSLSALGDQSNDEDVLEADLYVKKSYAGGFSLELHGGLFDVANTDSPYWQANLNATFDF